MNKPSNGGQRSFDPEDERTKKAHNLAEKVLTTLKKEYLVIGKTRIVAFRAWLFIGLLSGVVLGVALVAGRGGEFTPSAATVGDIERPYVPGELLIKFREDLPSGEADEILKASGATVKDEIAEIKIKRLKVPEKIEKKILEILQRRRGVEFVELNEIFYPTLLPNDPKYSSQWHLPKISMPAAWDVTQGTASVVIAIIDTGVDPSHPDLKDKLVPGYNFWDNNTNSADVYGHGTKVAGAAAAITNNAIGVSAPGWQNKIMPIRVGSPTSGGATTYDIMLGMKWAVDHGAKVLNVSYGWESLAGSKTIKAAAKDAKSKGVITINGSGNCSCFAYAYGEPIPDSVDLINVSATDKNDNLASFSGKGEYVDLAAPGVSIYTTAMGGGYAYPSGTSFSAPITAGVVALLFSVNPSLTPNDVEQILESTADDKGPAGKDTSFGYGRINAEKAVKKAAGFPVIPPPPPADTTLPSTTITSPSGGTTVSGTVSVLVSASDNVGVTKVELWKDGGLFGTDTISPYSFSWDTVKDSNGSHSLQAKAYDAVPNVGTSGTVSVNVSNIVVVAGFPVTLQGTALPEEKTVIVSNTTEPASYQNAILTMSVYDPDFPDEGMLYVNGNGPLSLFGAQGTSANDNKLKIITLSMSASWWKVGDNSLRFVHTKTQGYRIDSATVSFSAATLSEAGIIIDNDTVGTSKTGSWCTSGASGYYGANSLYSCGSGLDTYRWTPALSASAIYDVSMWWTSHVNRSSTAVIKIRDASGVITTKTVDEKTNGGKWNSLGIYTLGPGSYVETTDQNGQVSADAVKFAPYQQ